MPFESSQSIYSQQEQVVNEESSQTSQEPPKPFNSMDEFEKGFAEFMEFMTRPVEKSDD